MNKIDKEDALLITIPAGQPAGTYEFKYNSEEIYKSISGIAVYEISNGGLTNYRIGINNGSVTYHHPVSFRHFAANENTPQNERLKNTCIPSAGATIIFTVTTFAATVTPLQLDVVIGLSKQ